MSSHDYQPGDRVAAIVSAGEKVFWLGEGVYEGDFQPPGAMEITFEEGRKMADEHAKEKGIAPLSDAALKVHLEVFNETHMKNPRIKLDNGDIVWGNECWWGPADALKKKFEGRDLVKVRIERNERGFFERLMGEDGKEIPLNEV